MLSIVKVLFASLAVGLVAAGPHDVTRRHHVAPKELTVGGNSTLFKRQDNARFTMYYQTGNAGACGKVNSDSDFIVALNWQQYESGDWCWKMIELEYGGKTAQAQIVDECPGDCPYGAIDCSPALANYFGFFNGEVYGSWSLAGSTPATTSSLPPPPKTTHTTSSTPPPPPLTSTSSKRHTTSTTSSSSSSSSPSTSSSSSSITSSASSSSSAAATSSKTSSAPASSSSLASSTPSSTPIGNINLLNTNLVDMSLLVAAALQAH